MDSRSFHFGTSKSRRQISLPRGALPAKVSENGDVTDAPDWYLKEWLRHFGKKQVALINELGWTRNKANKVFHGRQPYRREFVNEVAEWLGIRPFELLMPPPEAEALRRIRTTAAMIVAESGSDFEADE